MAFVYFTNEQKLRANSVDLADFLQRRGEKLIPSGRDKRLASDKSITVRGSQWYDHAAEQGGHAIDFVQEHYNMSFPEAVTALLGGQLEAAPNSRQNYVLKENLSSATTSPVILENSDAKLPARAPRPFALPPVNSDMRRVYAYLLKQRCIDREVLTVFAKANLIYEDGEHHNAVFVGTDENGIPRHAHKKSTRTYFVEVGTAPHGDSFRINVEGSDPGYSFHFISKNPNPQMLFVFEAPIDMLSYISLHKKNWQNASYVSLCGISEKAILKMLELYPQLDHVVLCLDHDAAGIEANEKISDSLAEKGHYAVGRAVSKFKDWNEDLKARHGLEPLPAEEHPQQLLRDEICSEVSALCSEKKNADCSASALRNLFENFRIHRHCGRFDEANGCLRDLLTRSLLAAAKEYCQVGHIRDLGTVQSRLYHGFKTYENRGKFQRRMDNIQQSLAAVVGKAGVITQTEKMELAESYEAVAANCLKALITTELEQQKQEPSQIPEMTLTM